MPARVPSATCAANAGPCSRASRKVTGAEVSGSPTSQPLTAGPQRRPARLAAPMSAGARRILSTRCCGRPRRPCSFADDDRIRAGSGPARSCRLTQRRTAMKLVRYGRLGAEKPGLIDADGTLRDLSRVVKDITPAVLAPASLRKLRAVKTARLPIVRGKPRLGCPLAGIGKMVCIGLNYTDHAEEVGMALPKEPTVFIKAPSALCGPDDATIRPARRHEARLRVRAGRGHRARRAQRGRGQGAGARGRLLHRQRRLRARVPDGARRHDHQGQERRLLRPGRPVARHRRRDPATRRRSRCGRPSTASAGSTATPPR